MGPEAEGWDARNNYGDHKSYISSFHLKPEMNKKSNFF